MFIQQLKLNGFRCYEHIELTFDQRINVFCGDNGAGKTSILEAIYFLSTGKSFRSKRTKNLIKQQAEELVVFSQFINADQQPNQVGVSLSKQLKKNLRLNQQPVNNQSQIAHLLPVVSIDPDSYLFLDKPPQYRRSFLDWLVFHVKHEYLPTWSKVARCQKHLNSLYKSKALDDLPYWEQQYIQYSDQLNQLRITVFEQLSVLVQQKVSEFIPELSDFSIQYFQGWSADHTLEQQLNKDRDKNILYGNLNAGIHKMDIKNRVDGLPAHERLSRGQKKLISIIYYLSFIELIGSHLNTTPILCLDDMDAELDQEKTHILGDFIKQSDHQVFITTVDQNKLNQVLDEKAVFHVKHDAVVQQ